MENEPLVNAQPTKTSNSVETIAHNTIHAIESTSATITPNKDEAPKSVTADANINNKKGCTAAGGGGGGGRSGNGHKRKRHNNKNNNKNHNSWRKPPFKFKRKMNQHNNNKTDIENLLTTNKKLPNCRKYSQSTIFKNRNNRVNGMAKFFLPDNKRPRKELIVPPTKFLLGGNISDPLNLNSLQDEALNASMNAATPKSSPIATSPKVQIISYNSHDPLYLLEQVSSIEYEKLVISPLKRSKNRNRKRKARNRHDSMTSTAAAAAAATTTVQTESDADADPIEDSGKLVIFKRSCVVLKCVFLFLQYFLYRTQLDGTVTKDEKDEAGEATTKKIDAMDPVDRERCVRDLRLDLSGGSGESIPVGGRKRKISESHSCKNKLRRMDSMDKIVSPVIPQPGAWKRPPQILATGAPRNRHRLPSASISEEIVSCENERPDENPQQQQLQQQHHDQAVVVDSETTPSNNMAAATNDTEIAVTETPASVGNAPTTSDVNTFTAAPATFFKKENSKYQYGNYNYHFGFNNLDESMDVRLVIFKRNAFLFKDKDILDIGCNAGHLTIAIAKHLAPKSMVGIDIDPNLISKARWNLSMYVRIPKTSSSTPQHRRTDDDKPQQSQSEKRRASKSHHHKRSAGGGGGGQDKEKIAFFPISFPICYGGIPMVPQKPCDTSPTDSAGTISHLDGVDEHNPPAARFPESVYFRTMNYVPGDDSQLANDTQQYDLILCLSTTKWIHLNFGDAGLKLAFKRMFNQLRPGGKLILEAQNWASYKKRKKLTVRTCGLRM